MNVRSIFRPWVVSVDGTDRLAGAAEYMHNEQVGSVVVTVGGRFAGILTERDLTRAIADGVDPREATAAEYMTAAPAAVHLDADVHHREGASGKRRHGRGPEGGADPAGGWAACLRRRV